MREYDRQRALEAAARALDAASRELLQRFRRPPGELKGWLKSVGAPVTDADIASDNAIAEVLLGADLPGHLISEESVRRRSPDGFRWLIDPLCGTLPYRQGMGHWGVNIALAQEGVLELGVLGLPAQGETLTAVRGKGATRNGRRYRPQPPALPLIESTICVEIDNGTEWPTYAPQVQRWAPSIGAINMFSSVAYPMAQLLLGRLAAVLVYNVGPMHVAAGTLIATELGLRVSDAQGNSIDWTHNTDVQSFLAAWPEHHAALLEVMNP